MLVFSYVFTQMSMGGCDHGGYYRLGGFPLLTASDSLRKFFGCLTALASLEFCELSEPGSKDQASAEGVTVLFELELTVQLLLLSLCLPSGFMSGAENVLRIDFQNVVASTGFWNSSFSLSLV